MVYCAVQWCKNEQGKSQSKVEGRKFLRFFKFPKDRKMANSWKYRIGRRPEDVTISKMFVCSDHFNDQDFTDHSQSQIKLCYSEGMHIYLSATAIPNTDMETQAMVRPTAHIQNPLLHLDVTAREFVVILHRLMLLSSSRNKYCKVHQMMLPLIAPVLVVILSSRMNRSCLQVTMLECGHRLSVFACVLALLQEFVNRQPDPLPHKQNPGM